MDPTVPPAAYPCPVGYSCNLQVGAVWYPEQVLALFLGITLLIVVCIVVVALIERSKR